VKGRNLFYSRHTFAIVCPIFAKDNWPIRNLALPYLANKYIGRIQWQLLRSLVVMLTMTVTGGTHTTFQLLSIVCTSDRSPILGTVCEELDMSPGNGEWFSIMTSASVPARTNQDNRVPILDPLSCQMSNNKGICSLWTWLLRRLEVRWWTMSTSIGWCSMSLGAKEVIEVNTSVHFLSKAPFTVRLQTPNHPVLDSYSTVLWFSVYHNMGSTIQEDVYCTVCSQVTYCTSHH